MVSFKILVMANLGSELHWVWNQLRDKLLGTPLIDFLDEVIWNWKFQMRDATSDGSPYENKSMGKALYFLPLCIFGESFILLKSSSIHLLPPMLSLLNSFFNNKTQHIQTSIVNWKSGLFNDCRDFQHWLELLSHKVSWAKQVLTLTTLVCIWTFMHYSDYIMRDDLINHI